MAVLLLERSSDFELLLLVAVSLVLFVVASVGLSAVASLASAVLLASFVLSVAVSLARCTGALCVEGVEACADCAEVCADCAEACW